MDRLVASTLTIQEYAENLGMRRFFGDMPLYEYYCYPRTYSYCGISYLGFVPNHTKAVLHEMLHLGAIDEFTIRMILNF